MTADEVALQKAARGSENPPVLSDQPAATAEQPQRAANDDASVRDNNVWCDALWRRRCGKRWLMGLPICAAYVLNVDPLADRFHPKDPQII